VIPLIQEIVGGNVRVIDPAPSVAKQAKRLLEAGGMANNTSTHGKVRFYTSGNSDALKFLLPVLLGEEGEVERVEWIDDNSVIASLR
jgi:glutamate racemase